MTDKFTFSSMGEAQEVEFALARAGYTHPEVKELTKGDTLGRIRKVILGHAEAKVLEPHFIDLKANPFIPWCDWKVKQHQGGDFLKWDSTKVQLYLCQSQQNGKSISGKKLYKELKGKPALNANVLYYLLAHPYLIPEEWKKDEKGDTRYIFFWGTIYESPDDLYLLYLYFRNDQWSCHYRGLKGWWWFSSQHHDGVWYSGDPAALRAS